MLELGTNCYLTIAEFAKSLYLNLYVKKLLSLKNEGEPKNIGWDRIENQAIS